MKIPRRVDEALIASIDMDAAMETMAADAAAALVAAGEATPETVEDISPGKPFRIPLVIPEKIWSGDGRRFKEGALTWRDLPISLLWQPSTGSGHDGSYIVGRIDSLERVEGDVPGVGNALGVFDNGPYGREAQRLVENGFLRGVSADLDQFEAAVDEDDEELCDNVEEHDEASCKKKHKQASQQEIKNDKITVSAARIMAATLVPKPAFQECTIEIIEDGADMTLDSDIEDGMYEEITDDPELIMASLTASAIPVVPPRDWFRDPSLSGPTPITVEDDGRVFGHIAAWHVSHIGLPGRNQRPPRSFSGYAYFRTGVLRTDDGDVPVGQLTLAGGHAPLNLAAQAAAKHYDDTASAIADVSIGEDAFGIWVAGALRPEATPEQIRALRASAPSGDWRPIDGRLELVAICQVNVPGFPVARAMIAGGQLTALVAAGARPLAELRESRLSELETRLHELESIEFRRIRDTASSRLVSLVDEYDQEFTARRAALDEFVIEYNERQDAMTASARERISALFDEEDDSE